MINPEQFNTLFPRANNPIAWVEGCEDLFPQYDITTPFRVAAFLAQCGHETAGFALLEENLNYSAERLVQVWPRYFASFEAAEPYDHNPQKLANYVYADRMGNGPPESNDGWNFRGRGPIQLTGRSNYTDFAKDTYDNWEEIINNPNLVAMDNRIALQSALWFWDINHLNDYADTEDLETMTRAINGGINGLARRVSLYVQILKLLTH